MKRVPYELTYCFLYRGKYYETYDKFLAVLQHDLHNDRFVEGELRIMFAGGETETLRKAGAAREYLSSVRGFNFNSPYPQRVQILMEIEKNLRSILD